MSKQGYSLSESLNRAISLDGGLTVFEHYGFSPSKRAQAENPFRNERTSSFYVSDKFGKIIFKDFGDDEIKGDCRKFVQLYENCDYQEAFVKLCQIYNLLDAPTLSIPKRSKKPQKTKSQTEFTKELLNIKFKTFTDDELEFWQEKGGIDLTTLKTNRVKSVASFQLKVAPDKVRTFENLKFVFAYEIVANQSYKLYQPKAAYRFYTKSKTVFLPNLETARKKFGKDYQYSFGLDKLQSEKDAILCGGEADCLALKAMGYNAFTLGNERASLPPYIKSQLDQKNIQQLSVLYDTDFTGLQASQKLAEQENCQVLSLPKLAQQYSKNLPKPQANDLCDYLSLYGQDIDLELCLKQQVLQTKDFKISHTVTIKTQQYLQEKVAILTRFIKKYPRVQLVANAGMGKTYTLLTEFAAKQSLPVIFAVPFAIQVEQIEKEYQDKCPNLVCYSNQQLQNDEAAFLGFPPSKVNVCTYDRIRLVYEKLQQSHQDKIIVIVDESHLLTSEYGYRTRAINEVLDISKFAYKTVYLSATPDYSLCQFSNFKLIRFQRQENPQIKLNAVHYESDAKQALSQILLEKFSQTSPQKTTVIRLNNKTLAKVISNLLVSEGIFKREEIDFVFSEVRKSAETETKQSIIKYSRIPDKVKLLFVTACFDCGINILNEDIEEIISFEQRYTDNCMDTLQQFIARFRRLTQLQVTVYKPAHCQERPEMKKQQDFYENLYQNAQAKLRLLDYTEQSWQMQLQRDSQQIAQAGLQNPRNPSYLRANGDISAIHKLLRWHSTDNTYSINDNYIRFMLKEYERKNLSSEDFFVKIQQKLPNCYLIKRENLDKENHQHNETIKELWENAKTQRKNRMTKVCEIMQEDKEAFFDAIQAEYCDISLKQKIMQHFPSSKKEDAPKLESILKKYQVEGDIQDYDREMPLLSKRYFMLKNLLMPETLIPKLLEQHQSEVKFGALQKTLTNHLLLRSYQKAAKKAPLLFTDRRKLEDASWLSLLIDFVQDLKPEYYNQKKTQDWQRQLNHLAYDEKLLLYEQGNLLSLWFAELEGLQKGESRQTQVKRFKKRLRSIKRRLQRLASQKGQLLNKLDKSQVEGIELEKLSLLINRLRPHTSDWQGTRTNLRLLDSLFDLKIQKRAVLVEKDGKMEYKEKRIIKILAPKSFSDCLASLGLSAEESEMYQNYLDYQIALDLTQAEQQILTKSSKKSTESSNIFFSKTSSFKSSNTWDAY